MGGIRGRCEEKPNVLLGNNKFLEYYTQELCSEICSSISPLLDFM